MDGSRLASRHAGSRFGRFIALNLALVCLVFALTTFPLKAQLAPVAAGSQAPLVGGLVINEIDYDQASVDTAEFIEILNNDSVAINLDLYSLDLVNGSGGGAAVYKTIDLPAVSLAAGDYYVVCGNAATVANCDLDVTPDTDLIQNGAPDAVGLMLNGSVVDAVSYEGDTGAPYTEGTGTGLVDDPAATASGLSRLPNGVDTNQNNVDLSVRCITPGAASASENSNCGGSPTPTPTFTPTPSVSPSPTTPAPAGSLVINEIDYDQTSIDTAEFIEIRNNDSVAINLDPYAIQLVNGSGGGATVYNSIDLPAFSLSPGAYFVVCANAALTTPCNLDATPDTDLIQNGAPDAITLVLGESIIDTVSYEGDTAAPYTEGSGVGLEDSSAVTMSGVSRFPDATDTQQNNIDYSPRCISPGAPNVAGNTNCDTITPTPTATPTATPTNTPSPTPPPTPMPPLGDKLLYMNTARNGNLGGVAFNKQDVIAFDWRRGVWYMVFDGSDVGLGNADVDAFTFMPDGSLLFSLVAEATLPGAGLVDDSDVVRFTPASYGATTAGTLALYFDGSAFGLTDNAEDIDALALAADGDLLISTVENFVVPGLNGKDEDLARFDQGTGAWSAYFDGSDVELQATDEDVTGAYVDPVSGAIYLSVNGAFAVTGASGDANDIFMCMPGSIGNNTTCTYSFTWDGATYGYNVRDILDDIAIGAPVSPVINVSLTNAGSVGGLNFQDEDIMAYEPSLGVWYRAFDGSDVGLGSVNLDAFDYLTDGSLLLSVDEPTTLPGVGAVDDSDAVRFMPYSLGEATAGEFTMYVSGAAVELTDNAEDVDALDLLADGTLLVSTIDNLGVTGLAAKDEDLIRLDLNTNTWSLYFDGSDVGLGDLNTEDVKSLWVASNGDIYLSTEGTFVVPGLSGDGTNIFICTPGSLGNNTTCTFAPYWNGAAFGFGGNVLLDGIALWP